jgi:hypothetical protein
MDSARANVDTADAAWAYGDTVHGEPEGSAAGALLFGVFALFMGEEVGADESGVLAPEGGFMEGGAAMAESGRYASERRPTHVGVPMPSRGGPQQPQQRLDEASDMVQHVFNSIAVEGHAPGPFRGRSRGSSVPEGTSTCMDIAV